MSKSYYDWEESADYIDYTKKVLEFADECGSDFWKVVQISPMKAALFTSESCFMIPDGEIILKEKN